MDITPEDMFGSDDVFFKDLKYAVEAEGELVCDHSEIIEDLGVRICTKCGKEQPILDYSQEWRCYGDLNNTGVRCSYIGQKQLKSLDKLLDSLPAQIPESLRRKTEEKYNIVVGNRTMRGAARRSLVAACLLYAMRETGDIRTTDDIRLIFGLTKKSIFSGLTKYYEAFPKDRVKHITAFDILYRIMIQVGIPLEHYPKILQLMRFTYKCTTSMLHSSPQSISAAITFIYICMNPDLKETLGITKSKFAEKVSLSDITVTKLAKETREYLKNLRM